MSPRIAFDASVGPFPVVVAPAFFRSERRLDDSAKVVAAIFAGLGGGAKSYCSYHHSMQVRAASPRQSEEASRLLVAEARCSGLAMPASDFWLLLVRQERPSALLPRSLVQAGPLPAAFGMPCNLQPAPQSMRWPFAGHNESAPGRLSGVQRTESLRFLTWS